MAIHKSAYTGVYSDNHQEFICDQASDINSLPTQHTTPAKCPTGSKAFVIEDSSRWMLNSEGLWKQIFSGSGGSSGGGIGNDSIATDEEVDAALDDVFRI